MTDETEAINKGGRINASAWFGTQFGCTFWLIVDGSQAWTNDAVAGMACTSGFVLANLWGIYLWRRRERLSAHNAFQWLLGGFAIVIAAVVVLVNQLDTTLHLPYWTLAMIPVLMVWFRLFIRPRIGAAQQAAAEDAAKPRR